MMIELTSSLHQLFNSNNSLFYFQSMQKDLLGIQILQSENDIYVKEKLLGQGAFGKAYLVKRKDNGEKLVIKEMNVQHMSEAQRKQTVKEARILGSLNHPNIVTFRQVYMTKQKKLKIVMEFAENGDLAKAIHSRKSNQQYFQEGQILDWFTQICLAIKHVHDRKILHRDIKGQNIFIGANNVLKLGDFGIARVLNKTIDRARTVVGTPYYLSPQIIQNKPYSFKSDIWSMGVVLYQLCTLNHPFTATSLQFLALKIVKGSYPAIQRNYSKQLKNLVAQMLQLDPNKRPSVNDILKKQLITNRIKSFLSETKIQHQFSHTVLHNQKIQLNNKLVQIKNQNEIESERKKLKEQEARIQKAYLEKKQAEKKAERERLEKAQKEKLEKLEKQRNLKEKQQRQIADHKRKMEQVRKQRDQERKIFIEQQRKQQLQRQYQQRQRFVQMADMRKAKVQEQARLQAEKQRIMYQRYELQEQRRRLAQDNKKIKKQKQQDKRIQQLNEFARQQYFQNLQIRKRAEQRAKRQQMEYHQDFPSAITQPERQEKPNYHYEKRPNSRGNQRQGSSDQKKRSVDKKYSSNQQEQKKSSIIRLSDQDLQNAYVNPNFSKKQQNKPSIDNKLIAKRPSDPNVKVNQPKQQKKKSNSTLEQIKKDRQKFYLNKNKSQSDELIQEQTVQSQPIDNPPEKSIKVSKWQKRPRSSEKILPPPEINNEQAMRILSEDDQIESPRFKGPIQSQEGLIDNSSNLMVQINNKQEFDNYLKQLENIVGNVNKQVDALPDIPMDDQILFRNDDTLQFSLTAENKIKQDTIQMSDQPADFDYFCDFSKLETLRMSLQEAFGTENFISIYRTIQQEMDTKGLEGFNIIQVSKNITEKMGISIKLIMDNMSMLLTIVAMQQKMNF